MAQRINGFEQIKGFYSWAFENQELGVKPQHVSIYLFLINQNNRNNWIEWFKLPFDLAMAGSCISSKKTYYACLNDLQNWGLIQYKPGVNNWKAPLIKLEVLKDTSTVPQSEPQHIQVDIPQHIQALEQAAEQLPIHNIKLLTYNLKLITDNLEPILLFLKSNPPDKNPVHKECKDFFLKFYEEKKGTGYYFQAIDGKKLKSLTKKIEFKIKEKGCAEKEKDLEVIRGFKIFIEHAYKDTDNWTRDNFSLSVIDSKFNDIFSKIKNGQSTSDNKSADRHALAEQLRAMRKSGASSFG